MPPAAATGGHATGGLEGLFDDLQLDLGTAESATASDSLDDLGGGTRVVPAAPVAEPDLRAALGLDDDEEELEASERTAIFDPATLAAIEAEAARPSPLLGEPESAGAWGTDSDVAGSHAAGGDAGHSAWEAEAGTTADAETVVADEDIELLEDDAVEELPADGTTVSSEAAVDGASTEEQPTAAPPSQPPPEGPAGGFFRKIFGPRR
ncbi:MAG: hypothetical protein NZ898_06355 [Myxococcota bacterium]|nr:hypothetical protein [Myxococcota bacterium]